MFLYYCRVPQHLAYDCFLLNRFRTALLCFRLSAGDSEWGFSFGLYTTSG